MKYGSGAVFLSPRNFQLYANQIGDLGLDTGTICNSIAHALAVLHWHTKIDGMDAEYVRGSSPVEEQKIRVDVDLARAHALQLLTGTYEAATHSHVDLKKRLTSP